MISIIIPTLNEGTVLAGTLANLRPQRSGHEVIVADSGSTDNTVAIARSGADHVVSCAEHPGVSRGRNLGASIARGDLLAFVDADVTICDPDWFLRHVALRFRHDSKLVALVPQVKVAREHRTQADRCSYRLINVYTYIVNNMIGGGMGTGDCIIVRRSAFEKIGGFDVALNVCEDVDLCTRLSRIGRVRMVWGLLVVHPGRRPHAIGWRRLWRDFLVNLLSYKLNGRPYDDEWRVVR